MTKTLNKVAVAKALNKTALVLIALAFLAGLFFSPFPKLLFELAYASALFLGAPLLN